ncbi:hypothetical protein SMICM17S_07763 [Streptomyces microflavus]
MRSYAYENSGRYLTRWLGDLWRHAGDASPEAFITRGWDECQSALAAVQEALRDPSPETDPCERTGDGWIAEEALATALHCFLLFPEDPLTALRRAACTRGDSDSIACLAGAFAGARLGRRGPGPRSGRSASSTGATCCRWRRSGTLDPWSTPPLTLARAGL